MSLKRKADSDRIVEILSHVRSHVALCSRGNFTDINIYAENFYRDLLNLIFGYNLININIIDQNAAAIDLGDAEASIAIQVTSTSDIEKARKTVKKFNEKNLHEEYGTLKILNIQQKKKHKAGEIGDSSKLTLDLQKDIWDISDLVTTICDKTVPKVTEIRKFLEDEVPLFASETLPSEIQTFQSLIKLLSEESHPNVGDGFIEEPDPKGKIEERFSSHESYLKKEFRDLYTEYGAVLADIRNHADLGVVRVRRLRLHLKTLSDEVLSSHDGNPESALKELCEMFKGKISAAGGVYDLSAIRFYLIDELIRCNVFPNKEQVNVQFI